MGGGPSRLKPSDNEPRAKAMGERPKRSRLKRAVSYILTAATFCAAGTVDKIARAQDAGPVPDGGEIQEDTNAHAREAAEALRSFMREGSTEAMETFLGLLRSHSAEEGFNPSLDREVAALIRVDSEGASTREDAFMTAWAENEGEMDYTLLVQDIQLLRGSAMQAVEALRDFMLSGDADDRRRFEESFSREYLGQSVRENIFYSSSFARAFQHVLRDSDEAREMEQAYSRSTSRVGVALHDCYQRAGEGEVTDEVRAQLVQQHGEEFVALFMTHRAALGLAGHSVEEMIEYVEDHEESPDGAAPDVERAAYERVNQLREALGYNISAMVGDIATIYSAFSGESRDADQIRQLELMFGRSFVERIEERAAPPEVDEEEQQRMVRRHKRVFSDAFSALLNIDTLLNPGTSRVDRSELDRYQRYFERLPVAEQVAFQRWAAETLSAWERVNSEDLGEVRAFFREYFPRLPLPSGEHLPRFGMIMDVMNSYVSHGRFRFDNYMDQLQESADAFSAYIITSGRRDEGVWTEAMQAAFSAVVAERAAAARRRRLPRAVSIPEGGQAGADLAENLLPSSVRSLGEADRDEEVGELRARVAIADILTETVFGYDWDVIESLRIGRHSLFDEEGRRRMGRLRGIGKLAELHRTIRESSDFQRARDEYVAFITGPERALGDDEVLDVEDAIASLEDSEDDLAEAEANLGGSLYLDMLDNMDLLAQYAFCAVAFPAIRDETGLTMLEQEEGSDSTALERDATEQERMRYILDEVELFIRTSGRGGHVGFMIYAIPLSIEYSDTYNSVVSILNRIIATASTIHNTSMYDYAGRGRVAFMYMMEQVPRNFDEANNDNYNQLIDMMLRYPQASDYTSDDMREDMFDTRTLGEMLRRYMRLMSERSGAVRPSHIHPRRAPQDFNLSGSLTILEDDIRVRAGFDYGSLLSGMSMLDDEEREQTIQEMLLGSSDTDLTRSWRQNVDMHEEFLAFFRPSSVSLVPERSYRVISMIPMSISSLLRRLSSVEGVDRLIYPIDIRQAGGYMGVGVDHASFEQVSGGSEGDRQMRQGSGRGRAELNAAVWGPRQEGRLEADLQYNTAEDLETMSESETWAATQEIFIEDMPYFDEDLATGRSRFSATESFRTDRSETPYRRLAEVTDIRLTEVLDWYARRSDTDGALYITGLERAESSGSETDGEWQEESEGSHDWRVHSYAKIENRWYRVGYIDVSDDQLQRAFIAMQVPERWRDFGEARVLFGDEARREQTPGELEREVEVSTSTELEGMLVGMNISNLLGLNSPAVTLANIENFGRAIDELETDLPEDESAALMVRRMEEYANGISLLFRDHRPLGGFVRTVGYVVATARRYRTTSVYEPVGDGSATEEEQPDDWTGGGGAIVQMSGPREDDQRVIEAALAVGQDIVDTAIRQVEVQYTDTDGALQTEWRDYGEDLAEGEEILSERRIYRERQEQLGLTLGWRSANFGVRRLHMLALANTEAFEDVRGLVGFSHSNSADEDADGHVSTFGMVGGQYEPYYEDHELQAIFGIRAGNTRVQLSGMYSQTELITRIEEINSRLEGAYREIAELRTGSSLPADLGEGVSRSEEITRLEREIEVYSALRTALGIMGAQKFFGTAQWTQEFGDRTRAALEALYGGFDDHNLLINGWVEVDEAFALSYNMTALPFGSAGGRVVVPVRELTIAATAGGYWMDDEEGENIYGGLLWTRQDERFGIGGILGGGQRTSTFTPIEDEEVTDEEEIDEEGATLAVDRHRVEGMILGWHPVRSARMQHYIVLTWEEGSNVWQANVVPASDITTWRFAAGTMVTWIDRRGSSWRARADIIYRHMEELRSGTGVDQIFERDTVAVQGGVEVSPRRDLRFMFNLYIHNTDDTYGGLTEWNDVTSESAERRMGRIRVGGMCVFEWEF
ncbi:MAG: hypothetical protein ABIH29_04075 [Candidatus Micrarchaeota archaeon]